MIRLSRNSYEALIAASSEADSVEVCGVLTGIFDERESVVTDIFPAANVANTPTTRYAIDPDELFEILRKVEETATEVVGFYHSHPRGPPYPTTTDVERAMWRGYSYVICSVREYPVLDSWRWQGSTVGFDREAVTVPPR